MLLIGLVYANTVELELSDVNGKNHKLSDYKGQWVVVNYWATWCPPCLEEIPELVSFQNKYQDKNVTVLGVNYEDASEQVIKAFISEYQINYPVLLAEPDTFSPLGKIMGLPVTFIISPDGKVVHKKTGSVDAEYLESHLVKHQYSLGKVTVN